jgi:poly-gamma-glutamate synthesis protein (capsule biosynthesis protein)
VRIALIGVDAVTANYEVEPGVQTGVVDFDAGAGTETPGTNPWLSSQFLEDIAAATAQADVVIPYFHGGVEYVSVPPRWLVDGAHAAIDAGATMVVTNHPHVIGCLETYNGRPIVYSPGNFIFDQMFSVEVRSGFVLDLTLRGDRVVGLRCHGVEIQDFHQPRLMTAGEHAGLMDRFWSTTDRLADGEFG